MSKIFLALVLAGIAGCQTVQEKNQALVRDRFDKLRSLSTWKPTWCRLETHLTQPALARYREMFRDETSKLGEETWVYTWRARETSCEVKADRNTPLAKAHRSFLETAFCTLLQTHFVNSPFDELKIMPEDIQSNEEKVQIKLGSNDGLGLFLDRKEVSVETRTKSRGTLRAFYSDREHQWLPERIEQKTDKAILLLDAFEYSGTPVGGRRMLKSFWISVGDARALQHTRVEVVNCQNF